MVFDSNCKKCKTPFGKPLIGPLGGGGIIGMCQATITGFKCKSCGHWNDLQRRKGYKEHIAALKRKD